MRLTIRENKEQVGNYVSDNTWLGKLTHRARKCDCWGTEHTP